MQPYEIRQLRDGTIDYSNYYARPVRMLTPEMRQFCRQPKTWLFMAATVAVLALLPMLLADRTVGNSSHAADMKIQSDAEIRAAIADLRRQAGAMPAPTVLR